MLSRIFSFLLDCLLIFLLAVALFGISIFISLMVTYDITILGGFQANEISFLFIIFFTCLCIFMEYRYNATFGKMITGIRVSSVIGDRVTFWQAALRNSLKYLPLELVNILICEIFVYGVAESRLWINALFVVVIHAQPLLGRIASHDWFAQTAVIKKVR